MAVESPDSFRYLVVGPSWVGDMVMAQSLFIALRNRHPGCDIDVVAPEWSLPVLARMPEVRAGIALPVTHGSLGLAERYRLGVSLRDNAYTHAIVLPRSWKSALVPYFARIPVRTGYRGELRYGLLNDIRRLDPDVLRQTVQRYVAHAEDVASRSAAPPEIPRPELSVSKQNADRLLGELGLSLEKPVIGFMPGAEYGPAKQWPADSFAELAMLLAGDGYQVWIFGSGKEAELGEEIVHKAPGVTKNLCGKTELVDVVDLLACAEQVVTNDSGLMHVAAAVGVRVNVIYGSSTPDYTPPLTDTAEVFYKRLDCSPCFERMCKYAHYDCLKSITPLEVYTRMRPERGSMTT